MKLQIKSFFARLSNLAIIFTLIGLGGAGVALAQQYSESFYTGMRWRTIGPLRAGRTRAVSGVPSEPNVFYIGAVNGGVWKSEDYGRTWKPIFNHEPTGSIGAIAVSPSDPNVIYVGSGEGLHRPDLSVGDGVYKSTDAGKTWVHLGLRETEQIPAVAVDPNNPSIVFVAALGHPYGPNPERGIFRSTDGGKTWQKVLYVNEYTGGSDVEIDPQNPQIVYAALWQAQEAPWENGAWSGSDGGLFKSTDGGATWHKVMNGFPKDVVQVNVAIAASEPSRLYATLAYGQRRLAIYRSDDAGAHWYKITNDPRPAARIGGGDLPVPKVDPKNPNVVYSCSVVTWRSTDGGKTWVGIRGAPGGDDYQNMWINPNNPNVILLASDQGAIVTVDGGKTWSSWYNQLTAQVYHVNTDNAFPYRVCSGQQDSGSACVSSRGNWGEITERDWLPAGAEEYGYLVPDPLNPNIVYGGKLTKFNRLTGQTADVAPVALRDPDYRVLRTEPIVFNPVNPHILYFAANTLWETMDGGDHWKQISPDLSRKTWAIPSVVGKYAADTKVTRRGVIYAVAPSPLDVNRIWAGTDDGLVWLTSDGGAHWTNVTPPQLKPWDKVSIISAGHFSAGTAYLAINDLRLDDMAPMIFRTTDSGKMWTKITNGLPNEPINVVREDPIQKGLLFAGSETQVFVSFNDGDQWQSLRLNMPASSVRDLRIHDNDLIAGTHGRGFWILDDITPLRQIAAAAAANEAYLYRPEPAWRVRWDVNTDTPLPPDVAHAQNPPDGAILDYYLKQAAAGPVTLEILDSAGQVVRRYSSTDKPRIPDPYALSVPAYWARPHQPLLTGAGMHRFIWDLHWTPAPGFPVGLPMQAVVHDTPPGYTSPWVLPGRYTVKLIVDGQSYTQPLTIRMDPRVKTPPTGIAEQFHVSKQLYDGMIETYEITRRIHAVQDQLNQRKTQTVQQTAGDAIGAFEKKLEAVEGQRMNMFAFFFGGGSAAPSFMTLRFELAGLLGQVQAADVAPTAVQIAAAAQVRATMTKLVAQWNAIRTTDLAHLNAALKAAGVAPVTVPAEKP